MGCTSGNCGDTQICKVDIISPHAPPKGGWGLAGWPPGVPESFKREWRGGEVVWNGNNPNAVLSQVIQVCDNNGIALVRDELCQWANEQWCQKDPGRCALTRNSDVRLASQRNDSYVGDQMQWATPYWKMLNVAVSDFGRPDDQAAGVLSHFVEIALHLTDGNYGCPSCNSHFRELLTTYPVGNVRTWKAARVWVWRVHNETRESGSPVGYYDIAKINGWEELSDQEVMDIIENELRTD